MAVSSQEQVENCTLKVIQSVDLTFFQDKQFTVVPILKINVFAVLHLIVRAHALHTAQQFYGVAALIHTICMTWTHSLLSAREDKAEVVGAR